MSALLFKHVEGHFCRFDDLFSFTVTVLLQFLTIVRCSVMHFLLPLVSLKRQLICTWSSCCVDAPLLKCPWFKFTPQTAVTGAKKIINTLTLCCELWQRLQKSDFYIVGPTSEDCRSMQECLMQKTDDWQMLPNSQRTKSNQSSFKITLSLPIIIIWQIEIH